MFESLVPNIRVLKADDLGIGVKAKAEVSHGSSAPDAPEISPDHPIVKEAIRLSEIFGGVIFSGPPGTSKSFFAAAAAEALCDKAKSRYRFVQFHASYQYEDFMVGFTPTPTGFEPKEGPFLKLIKDAQHDPENTYVLVIDELSRADVGRVFGEALTYVERSKRELPFTIANGEEIKVPSNFVVLATMNPFDRGVDEVDAAFERRFAKFSMDPDPEILGEMLASSNMEEGLATRLLAWFRRVNSHAQKNPSAAVGHAYFYGATDEASLKDIWEYQLKYLVQRAFRRDDATRADIETHWRHVLAEGGTEAQETSENETVDSASSEAS